MWPLQILWMVILFSVRQELLFYSPEYVKRPHIVVLNKLDLSEGWERNGRFTRCDSGMLCRTRNKSRKKAKTRATTCKWTEAPQRSAIAILRVALGCLFSRASER